MAEEQSKTIMANPRQDARLLPLHIVPPQTPYYDDPSDDEDAHGRLNSGLTSPPPGYASMFEYLRERAKRFPHLPLPEFGYTQQSSDVPLRTQVDHSHHEPYRDDPCIVEIDPPPPAYEAIPSPQQSESPFRLGSWEGEDEDEDTHPAEEFLKWMVCMLLLALSVVSVGTAFNWGR
ncbi:hypothetical protein F5884DRAFT_776636 [Xylogone sp. PMI_703]|nr:hypothetical protein F5884DRAFT_776636 [Xylogone sp. PMI_703]